MSAPKLISTIFANTTFFDQEDAEVSRVGEGDGEEVVVALLSLLFPTQPLQSKM